MNRVNPCCSANAGAFTSRDLSCVALCDMRQEVVTANLTSGRNLFTTLLRRGLPSNKIAGGCLRQTRPDIQYHRPLANDTDRERRVLRLLSIPEIFEAPDNNLSAATQSSRTAGPEANDTQVGAHKNGSRAMGVSGLATETRKQKLCSSTATRKSLIHPRSLSATRFIVRKD